MREALADAGLRQTTSMCPGHGTGTLLGDAVEIAAINEVFSRSGTPSPRPR